MAPARHAVAVTLFALALSPACAARAPRSRAPGPEARVVPNVTLRSFVEDRCGPGSLSLVLNALGDPVSDTDLDASLPKAPGGGTLSVDLLLAARARGFDASLEAGSPEMVRTEIDQARAAILMLRLLDAPGERRDVYHYVVVDGFDPGRGLFRIQFGDGKARWARLDGLEKAWRGAGHALLRVRPGADPAADLRRAVELENADRPEEAAAVYRQVLAVRPASVRAWVNLGNTEARLGRRAEAEKAYRAALVLSPDDRDALNNLAFLLLEEGARVTEAEALATRAAAAPGPDRPRAQDTLGRVQLARGNCEAAARTFEQALSAPEELPGEVRAELLEGLGRAQSACGRREEPPP